MSPVNLSLLVECSDPIRDPKRLKENLFILHSGFLWNKSNAAPAIFQTFPVSELTILASDESVLLPPVPNSSHRCTPDSTLEIKYLAGLVFLFL